MAGQRSSLMPIDAMYPLDHVMDATDKFIAQTNRQVVLQYVLIAGVNDTVEHAAALVDLLERSPQKRLYHVNLSGFNGSANGWRASCDKATKRFGKIVAKCGATVSLTNQLAHRIGAAAGQLKGAYKDQIDDEVISSASTEG